MAAKIKGQMVFFWEFWVVTRSFLSRTPPNPGGGGRSSRNKVFSARRSQTGPGKKSRRELPKFLKKVVRNGIFVLFGGFNGHVLDHFACRVWVECAARELFFSLFKDPWACPQTISPESVTDRDSGEGRWVFSCCVWKPPKKMLKNGESIFGIPFQVESFQGGFL